MTRLSFLAPPRYDTYQMAPPGWLDENGTRKCVQPTSDREYPLRLYRYQHLRMIGWDLYRVASFTS